MADNKDIFLSRRALCAGGASAVAVALLGSLVKRTVLIPGLSETADKEALRIRKKYTRSQMYEGLFYDRCGTLLQTPAEEPGRVAKLLDPLPYRLIGYYSGSYGWSGLRQQLYQYLYSDPGPDKHGGAVQLTLHDTLQRTAYEAVCKGAYGASAVVMDCDTGELLCCTSSQFSSEVEYDVNTYHENVDLYESQNNARNRMAEDPAFTCSTLPGSSSKLLTAAAMVRSGAPLEYNDTTGSYEHISNFKKQVLGKLDLTTALVKSANVYFAAGADAMGAEAMLAEMELWGYNMVVPLDNGQVLTPTAQAKDLGEARQLSIGQGDIKGCSLWNAMLYGALCSGKVITPHLIKSVTSTAGQVLLEEESPQTLAEPLADQALRNQLATALEACGKKYGLAREGWKIMAKTGTAEVGGWNNSIHLCAALESPSGRHYAVALNRQNTTDTSSALLGPAATVVDCLMEREGEM